MFGSLGIDAVFGERIQCLHCVWFGVPDLHGWPLFFGQSPGSHAVHRSIDGCVQSIAVIELSCCTRSVDARTVSDDYCVG